MLANAGPGDDLEAMWDAALAKAITPHESEAQPKVISQGNGGAQESTTSPMLKISRWSDLSIGIDEHGHFLAVPMSIDTGSVFPVRKSTRLKLSGPNWDLLTELLDKSSNGNTADKYQFSLRRNKLGALSKINRHTEEGKLRFERETAKAVKGDAGKSASYMSKNLRELVACENDRKPGTLPPISASGDREILTGFTVRYLIRECNGKLIYGKKPH